MNDIAELHGRPSISGACFLSSNFILEARGKYTEDMVYNDKILLEII
jgi:hypothetical protein